MDELIDFLEENGLDIVNFSESEIIISYKFDLVEINAATSYANDIDDITDSEKEVEKKQYLTDIADDNISEIIEEAIEELNIDIKYQVLENKIMYQEFKVILN